MNIVAENIHKYYNNHVALKSFSAEFKSGHITGLLGPNGAGKTSFIRILNQILKPDGGSLMFDGHQLSSKHIEQIGYLPEERGLYKKMKVLDQIVYLARLKGLDKSSAKAEALSWLDKLGLNDWKKARIESLSKGMAQKIQFICTVIHDPQILILDEPFSGFDPINTNLIKQEIFKQKEAGKTILLATHNMASVEEICEDVILLNKGTKIIDGSVKDIKQSFRPNIYEVEFKGNMIGFTNALWAGYELIDRTQLSNDHFSARIKLLNDNTLNNLLSTVLSHVQIQRVEELLPDMNEIFIKAVEGHLSDE